MDHDMTSASCPQGSGFPLVGNDSPIYRAQRPLSRYPQLLSEAIVPPEGPSQPAMEHYALHLVNDGKVPIPRGPNPGSVTSKRRVNRACDPCREQKAKCSGQHPACQRCRQSDITCIYSDNKRERDNKRSADYQSRVQVFEDLLRNLHPHLDPQLATLVENVVSGVRRSECVFTDGKSDGAQLPVTSSTTSSPNPAEDGQQATNNPVQPTDHTVEDHNRDRDAQATGFVGRPSEVAWLHDLQTGLNSRTETTLSLASNYFLDDMQVLSGNQDHELNWPSEEAATELVESYFQNVHASFPLVGKLLFWEQFRCSYANRDVQPGTKWIAILNLIFAIASRHTCLVGEQFGVGLSYFTRAWDLYTKDFVALEHPSLQQVQIESLISLYLLSVGQINRAWRMCAIALRSAVAMGLHLRTENEDVSSISKETRYRLWWALYSLDVQLCLMTGRPLNMDLEYCTTPLPVPYPEEQFLDARVAHLIADEDARKATVAYFATCVVNNDSGFQQRSPSSLHSIVRGGYENNPNTTFAPDSIEPNTSLYFLCRVGLACLGRRAMDEIHSPRTVSLLWDEIETSISRNNASVDHWLAQLPSYYNFDKSSRSLPFARQRTSLAFRFYSIKLIILEPCLRRLMGVPTEGPCSSRCQTMAAMCMQVAGNVLDLLPDEPDIPWIYEYCPWWSIVHYIMQSSTILLVSLAGQIELDSVQLEKLSRYIRKAYRWLQGMSRTDELARRACQIFQEVATCHVPDLVCVSISPS